MLLAGLNQGKHAWDIIFNRFIGMVYNMVRSKNEKLSLIALSGLEDKRSIIIYSAKCRQNQMQMED